MTRPVHPPLQAVLLAGGLGTRLRSVVADRPKVLAPVAGRPFLAHILDSLLAAGFEQVCLATGYLGEQIEVAFGSEFPSTARQPQLRLSYSREETPLGTGGAILKALKQLPAAPTFVLNGDTYLRPDWMAMLAGHLREDATISIAVRHVDDVSRYGAVELANGRIRAFGEKSGRGGGLMNAGAYLLSSDLFDLVPAPPSPFSMERDVIASYLSLLHPLAFVTDSPFLDIGVPADFHRAAEFLSAVNRDSNAP